MAWEYAGQNAVNDLKLTLSTTYLEYFFWCLWEEERYHLYLMGEDIVVDKALLVCVCVDVYGVRV